ncbi:MAG: hypothetical protein IBX50_09650 [Marinospirillum sp.]|uniref:hypothetical protein n=1 Tax=Marinospirillum sp. TaxID=2183934 RepID=UPI0019E48839|nr:hypothetical protein [Marinospirillum sp.]MBE0506966.1 hypothetical protein [Marinospirillum sp.]
MRYLKLKKHCRPRADGTVIVDPIIVDSPRKYAAQRERRETYISKRKCHLVFGAHDSGKSRWLQRMHGKWEKIWGAKISAAPVFLGALHPVSTWTDQPHVEKWHDKLEKAAAEHDPDYTLRPWAKLNQQQRSERLADYLADTGALLFIDDAHKLTGRKLELARRCVISANIWLIATSQENRLPPNLRTIIDRREPQRTRLMTDAAYDATSIVMWLIIVIAIGIGWWEAALILGGLKVLGSGRRAARPD